MSSLPRLLVLIGSGETQPPMARVERRVIKRLQAPGGRPAVRATLIDTPFGFQANADALSATLLEFMAQRLGLDAQLASFRRADGDALERERAAERVREAAYVFSGPGSPSYALRQWRDSPFPDIFRDKLRTGGALVMASAAALTMGRFSVPVYEIYKSGEDPFWLAGLDVLATAGIAAAVIPHWDNAEGPGHDTRFCFLGERRLRMLEEQLPADVVILGIDEHTALVADLDADTARVDGRGSVTIRRRGAEVVFESGSQLDLDELRTTPAGTAAVAADEPAAGDVEADLARQLLAARDRAAALNGRAGLVEPLVEELLQLRAEARAMAAYAVADRIRDRLTGLGIEVTDEADGRTAFRLPDSAAAEEHADTDEAQRAQRQAG